ncbi:MAG: hypothetical protein KGJ59_10350 [Bacteroidota bacterium]|nr:hypothetical protein [Bacteroidota bacterium]
MQLVTLSEESRFQRGDESKSEVILRLLMTSRRKRFFRPSTSLRATVVVSEVEPRLRMAKDVIAEGDSTPKA